MIGKEDLIKKIALINDNEEKLFAELGLLPNLIFSYNEDENMVLMETFSYGPPEGRKRNASVITPEEFYNMFFKY